MEGVLLGICVFIFLLLIIFYPFKIKAMFHVNLFKNVGFVVIRIFGINVFGARFNISDNGKFDVKRMKKKSHNNKNKKLTKEYFKCLAKEVDVKKIELIIDLGIEKDAYKTAMFCGELHSFASILYAYALRKYKHINILSFIEPKYSEDVLEASGAFVASLCLMDMIKSICCALKKVKKKEV